MSLNVDVRPGTSELAAEELQTIDIEEAPFSTDYAPIICLPAWQNQFELIDKMLLYSNVLFSLTALEGAGVSTFLRLLIDYLPDTVFCQLVTATNTQGPSDLMQEVIKRFSLNSLSCSSHSDILCFIEQINERKQHCFLIIDDAENLSQSALQFLYQSIVSVKENQYFHLLLAGGLPLTSHLELALGDCNHESTYHFSLPEKTVDELRYYLEERLQHVGYSQDFPFDDQTLLDISQKSQGRFSSINQLASIALAESLKPRPKFDLSLSRWQIHYSGIIFFSIVFLIILFNSMRLDKREVVETLQLPRAQVVKVDEHQQRKDVSFLQEVDNIGQVGDTQVVNKLNFVKHEHSQISDIGRRHSKNKKHLYHKPKKKIKQKKMSVSNEPILKKHVYTRPVQNNLTRMVVVDSLISTPKIIDKGSSTNKKYFGVQIVASKNIKQIKAFALKHKLKNIRIIKKQINNQNWYTLVAGQYASKNTARANLNKLSKRLNQEKLWVASWDNHHVVDKIG